MKKTTNSGTRQTTLARITDALARITDDGAPEGIDGNLPLTVTRPELMPDGTDRECRQFVHRLSADDIGALARILPKLLPDG